MTLEPEPMTILCSIVPSAPQAPGEYLVAGGTMRTLHSQAPPLLCYHPLVAIPATQW